MTLAVGSNRNIHCIFLFKNYGPLAGDSQPHPHSQLVALPTLPARIYHELAGARHYYEQNRSCFYCDKRDWELRTEERLIEVTGNFMTWCPFTSRTPYQVVVGPRFHQSYFANISTHPQGADLLTEFALLLQKTLKRILQPTTQSYRPTIGIARSNRSPRRFRRPSRKARARTSTRARPRAPLRTCGTPI